MVDLGWNNYDREFAYIHPAIVIKETPTKIFIVPCSSGTPRKDKNGNILEGYINMSSDGYMFMSVPYERGMRILVDNTEINYDIILDSFIGFNIKSGNHNIHIKYIPAYLLEGSYISIFFLIITFIYLLKRKKTI